MPVEYPVNHEALIGAVRDTYGLELTRLEYLDRGMVSAYRASGADATYFLKLFPNTPMGREAASRLEGEHALLQALREEHVLERVPTPIRAMDGSTRSSFQDTTFALYGWIEGETLWGRKEGVLEGIATMLGQLHAASGRLLARHLRLPFPEEDFGLPFEAQLIHDLERLERVGRGDRSGLLALRNLLRPRRNELMGLLERATHFQHQARSRPRPNVVAHTDLHGGNLVLDPSGQLWALDWETARAAPAEHDLWMYHARLEAFLPQYEAALGVPCELDADLIGFYFYRRTLEDLGVDVTQIVNENVSDEQDHQNLRIIEEHILPWWSTMASDLERVREALLERQVQR